MTTEHELDESLNTEPVSNALHRASMAEDELGRAGAIVLAVVEAKTLIGELMSAMWELQDRVSALEAQQLVRAALDVAVEELDKELTLNAALEQRVAALEAAQAEPEWLQRERAQEAELQRKWNEEGVYLSGLTSVSLRETSLRHAAPPTDPAPTHDDEGGDAPWVTIERAKVLYEGEGFYYPAPPFDGKGDPRANVCIALSAANPLPLHSLQRVHIVVTAYDNVPHISNDATDPNAIPF